MPAPQLTFFCELDPVPLQALLNPPMIADLQAMNAHLSLGLRDFSLERAQVVRDLNQAGIPVTAWLLLPKEEGYWFNLRNGAQAARRYSEFRQWSAEFDLHWAKIGLDFEPDSRELADLTRRNWHTLPNYLRRLFARLEWQRGLSVYRRLIAQIQADGFFVESYQLPLIADERIARSSVLQRVLGLVNLPTDREVWMLYTSYVRPHGAGMIASYAPHAPAIAVGSTGKGVDVEFGEFKPLTWEELERDLRLAWHWCDGLYIFSLEGCVQKGFLQKIRDFTWDRPIILPASSALRVDGWRRSLQSVLWLCSHTALIGGFLLGGYLIWRGLRNLFKRASHSKP